MRQKRMVNLSMVLTCLVLILCALFAAATYQSIRRLLYDEKASHVLNLTHSSVGELEAEMQKSVEEVGYLSQFVTYTIENNDDIANEISNYAGQFQQKFGYADIYITDAEGNVLLNDRQSENISDRDYFIYGMKGNSFLSEPLYDRVTGRRVVVFGSPYYVDEQVHGIVIATKRLEDLYEPFNVQVFNGDGYAYVTNSYGDVIIASLHNESNKTASNIFEYINSDHNTTRKIQGIRNGMAAGITWAGEVNNGQEACYICYVPINISHSSEGNWYMVSMVPLEKMMQNSNRILARAALLIAMVIAVILSAAAWHRYSDKKQQQHIEHLAYFDELTGLHSVNYLRENYDRFLESSAKNNRRYAYIVFDIDKFKILNETLGYHEGDAILKAVADVLRSHLADGEEAVRIANDQFGVLLYFEGRQQLEQRLLKWERAFDDAVKQNVILLNRLRFSFGMYEIRS